MLQVRYRQGVLAGTVKIQVSCPLLLKISLLASTSSWDNSATRALASSKPGAVDT